MGEAKVQATDVFPVSVINYAIICGPDEAGGGVTKTMFNLLKDHRVSLSKERKQIPSSHFLGGRTLDEHPHTSVLFCAIKNIQCVEMT